MRPAWAALPVLFLVEDNGYAISVPVEAQTAGGSISRLTEGFPGLLRQEVDGTDFLASYRAMKAAVELVAAQGKGTGAGAWACDPAVLAFALRRRTPLQNCRRARRRSGARSGPSLSEIPDRRRRDRPLHAAKHHTRKSTKEVHAATHQALLDEAPAPETALTHLYSDTVDPTADAFIAQAHFSGPPMTMVDY